MADSHLDILLRETPEGEVDRPGKNSASWHFVQTRPAELDEPLNDSKNKQENPKKESEE